MTDPNTGASRRDFLKTGGAVAAAATLAQATAPLVHAGEENTIQVALIGCGGRGTGAAENALLTQSGPIKLVAMADVFEDRLGGSYSQLEKRFTETKQLDVPDDRKFVGFDAYRKAIDCLKPGDIAIFATPPGFRWLHFAYAIEKGVHVFMEKPVTVDGPTSRRMLELNEKAVAKNLKVGVGLMCRHCKARAELVDRVRSGQIGDVIALRAYRQTGPVGSAFVPPRPDDIGEVAYQIRRFHGFLWASGGAYSDFLIHNVDECCWVKGDWPVKAEATGARTYRDDCIDQNFDTYSVEYTFPDGSKFFLDGRNLDGCKSEFASYVHGSKNSAVISTAAHSPAKCRIYKGQKLGSKSDLLWAFPQPEPNPYQLEWDHLVEAIRTDHPFNETERGVKASLVTSMGRMAAHTGVVVTYDDILNSSHEFAPELEKLTMDGPAPLQVGPNGKYPIPLPGIITDREFG